VKVVSVCEEEYQEVLKDLRSRMSCFEEDDGLFCFKDYGHGQVYGVYVFVIPCSNKV